MKEYDIILHQTKIRKMAKKLLYLFMVLFVAIACNNTQQADNETATTSEEETTLAQISVANFITEAENYVDQEVEISGIVNHTCKHGGQRMFIIDEGTEETVKIEAGGNIDSFEAELEGSVVTVTGIVKEMVIDEDYLVEWEAEIMEGETEEMRLHDGNHGEGEEHQHAEGEEHQHGEAEEGETEEDHHGSDLEKIENLRNMLKESEKDHLSFYSIECISYEVAPPPAEEEN